MRKLFLVISFIILGFSNSFAYDFNDKFSIGVGADVNANYLYRGSTIGGLNIQPWVEISYGWFTVGAWNNIGFGNYFEEFNILVPETDVYFSITSPQDHISITLTQFYYYDRSWFFGYENDGNNSTQTELSIDLKLSNNCPIIFSVNTMIGGGDCYAWEGTYLETGKLYSTYISFRYEGELSDSWYIEPEVGFSPNRSCYTYYNADTKEHSSFALNNISLKAIYTFYSNDILSLSVLGHIHSNLFNLGKDHYFYPGRTLGWNVGINVEL